MADQPLIDASLPSLAWERLARPWVVLPIGACEQHGPHLPLNTDALEATHFGRILARELGAGLLPTLPLLQSYEHTGFRGTVSLRPETAMAILRDLADDLERQHFTRLIVLNFHGGNFALKPLIRDLNRHDRPLRVLLIDGWEYDTSAEGRALAQGEIHAGAWETSLMLALHPELVGDYTRVESPPGLTGNVRQPDLTHLGLGVLRPVGVWGDPRRASAEAGRVIAASIATNLVAAVRERLAWLDEQPSYAGRGDAVLRPLLPADFPVGVALCRAVGWNQRLADWQLFHTCNPAGCFVAQHRGKVVGTVTTINYAQRASWVAMVLVDPTIRRMGIGTKLLRAAFDALADCACVKLDATPAGKQLYDTLGFVDEYRLSRCTVAAVPPVPPPTGDRVRPLAPEDLEAIIALDAAAFGVARPAVLRGLYAMAPALARVALDASGAVVGFCLGREGENFTQLGPLQAPDLATAQALASSVLATLTGRPALTDIMLHTPAWRTWLESLGFREQRPFIRMYRGTNLPGNTATQFSITGPELG